MPGATYERIYQSLKDRLGSGHYAPGIHLDPTAIGEELFASATPVRDALHRLVGERIVTAPRHDGFRVPSPTEAELRAMYGWRSWLVELAVRKSARSHDDGREERMIGAAPMASIFHAIADRTGAEEICTAVANINDRLGLFARAEATIFPDMDADSGTMSGLLDPFAAGPLRREVACWHRRFQRHAPALLQAAARRATIVE